MIKEDKNGIGRIEVRNLDLPDYVKEPSGTYTYSGKVLVDYKRDGEKGFLNIAIVNDNGSGFKDIYNAPFTEHPKANGTRFMPFQDNKRVLLGDYVLECSPDIDNCKSSALIPVEYPWGLKDDPGVFKHWSEIIISPDNKVICWTSLSSGFGAANSIGKLVRLEDKYVIEDPQIISQTEAFGPDPNNEGYVIPTPIRGGEVKQFVKGGTAISMVGAKESALADSVVQDLKTEEIFQITRKPGYEETTILSPDESLGIVMTTRFSPKTNFAILGLMPRPHVGYATQSIIMPVYSYGVAGVRSFREGNVGPAIIDIEKSMVDKDYMGVALNDPDGSWVYLSPMSWHPGGRKVMWPEMLRMSESDGGIRRTRIRIAELLDYDPGPSIPYQETPLDISYGVKDKNKLWTISDGNVDVKIAGKHSGHMEYIKNGKPGLEKLAGVVESRYVNYSDDGKTFFNGYEKTIHSMIDENIYEAKLEMTGEDRGEMDLKITFSKLTPDLHIDIVFDVDDKGEPKSFGYATYGGQTIRVDEMR